MKAKKIHEVLDQAACDFHIHDYCEVENAISLESIKSAKKKDKMYYSDLRDLAKWITAAKECCEDYKNAVGDTNMLFVAAILSAELKSKYNGLRVRFDVKYKHDGKYTDMSSYYLSSIEHGLMENGMSLTDYYVTNIGFRVSITDRAGRKSVLKIMPDDYTAYINTDIRKIFAKDLVRQYSVVLNITKGYNEEPEEDVKMKKVKVTKVTKTSTPAYVAGSAPVNTDDSVTETECNENIFARNISPANATIDALGYTWILSAEKPAYCGNTQQHRWNISLKVIEQRSGKTKVAECACGKELTPAIFHMEDLSYNARKVHSMLDAILDHSTYRERYFNSKQNIPYIGIDIRPLPGDNWSAGTVSVVSTQIVICELMVISAFLTVCGAWGNGFNDDDTDLELFMSDAAVRDLMVNLICELVHDFMHSLHPISDLDYASVYPDFDMECGDCDHDCDDCDCDCNEH